MHMLSLLFLWFCGCTIRNPENCVLQVLNLAIVLVETFCRFYFLQIFKEKLRKSQNLEKLRGLKYLMYPTEIFWNLNSVNTHFICI